MNPDEAGEFFAGRFFRNEGIELQFHVAGGTVFDVELGSDLLPGRQLPWLLGKGGADGGGEEQRENETRRRHLETPRRRDLTKVLWGVRRRKSMYDVVTYVRTQ